MSISFMVTDTHGQEIGEVVDANPRQVVLPLNRVPTGSITVDTRNPLARDLRKVDQALIKVYHNGQLLVNGPCVPGYQKQVQPGQKTMLVNFAGVGWRLGQRLIEASKSTTGVTYGTATNFMDRGQMAVSIINGLNSAPQPQGVDSSWYMDTGVRIGSVPATNATMVGPWYYKNALQAISELSGTLDGFDWQIVATEVYADSVGTQLGTFNCARALGSTKSNVVWEYGDGKNNVASFTEQQDSTGACNRIYSLPSGFPNTDASTQPSPEVLSQWDSQSINSRRVIYEDILQDDLTTSDLRSRLMAQNLTVRKQPKVIITFQPIASADPGVVPQYGTDYVEGDIFQFRAVEYGQETVNSLFRCYGVTLDVSKEGQETVTPLLISQDN